MRIYLQPPQPSRGLQRIAGALRRYAPPQVEILSFPRNADLTVIYAIGRCDAVTRQAQDIVRRGKQYAVIQVCLRSTMKPDTWHWSWLWHHAKVVWSYYDLKKATADDGGRIDNWDKWVNFLHAPLGVDSELFQPHPHWDGRHEYVIMSSGKSRLSESVRECHLAAQAVGRRSCHLGPVGMTGVDNYTNMPDDVLRGLYNHCEFVSGLRRIEGFELPAAEGLLSGCRPILFDTPDFRWNYKDWGLYIHEGTRQEVVNQLVEIFSDHKPQVTEDEIEEARHWFNWERVCGEFWARCL